MLQPMNRERPALILFSHGSLLCGAGRTLADHAELLRATGEWLLVEPGYINYTAPCFEEAVRRCATAGAKEIVVVPYLLLSGRFVTEELPQRLEGARGAYPGVRFALAEPIGYDPEMADSVIEMAASARPPLLCREDLASAPAFCEARQTCPLHGSKMCPAVSQENRE